MAKPTPIYTSLIPAPTHTRYAHPHTRNLKPDKDEMRGLIELERMFNKWGYKPQWLEGNNGPNPLLPTRKDRNFTYTNPDYLEETYKEFGMTTEVYEPCEFE